MLICRKQGERAPDGEPLRDRMLLFDYGHRIAAVLFSLANMLADRAL